MVIIAIVFFVVVFFIIRFLKLKNSFKSLVYCLIPFFSPAENKFYTALNSFITGRCRVFAKVRLADLVSPSAAYRSSAWFSSFNRVALKHIDFILCDSSGRILCGIELDDPTHSQSSRITRDKFVDSVFQDIKIPLFHIPVRSSYMSKDFLFLDICLQNK